MVIHSDRDPTVVGIPKNCFRCGQEYLDYSDPPLSRVGPCCRKKKNVPVRGTGLEIFGKPLTVRENQVVAKIAEAKLNKEIAHELHLVEGTVKVVVGQIFGKLGFTNRTQVAVWYITGKKPVNAKAATAN